MIITNNFFTTTLLAMPTTKAQNTPIPSKQVGIELLKAATTNMDRMDEINQLNAWILSNGQSVLAENYSQLGLDMQSLYRICAYCLGSHEEVKAKAPPDSAVELYFYTQHLLINFALGKISFSDLKDWTHYLTQTLSQYPQSLGLVLQLGKCHHALGCYLKDTPDFMHLGLTYTPNDQPEFAQASIYWNLVIEQEPLMPETSNIYAIAYHDELYSSEMNAGHLADKQDAALAHPPANPQDLRQFASDLFTNWADLTSNEQIDEIKKIPSRCPGPIGLLLAADLLLQHYPHSQSITAHQYMIEAAATNPIEYPTTYALLIQDSYPNATFR